jgi:hypothetical protein
MEEMASRFMLIKTPGGEHVLLYAIHHIAFDGWSLGIFINELNLYYSHVNNIKEEIFSLPPAVNYADYSLLQRMWSEDGSFQKQIDYWKQNLAGVDLSEKQNSSIAVDLDTISIQINIEPETKIKIEQICRKKDISLFMLLFTAFSEVICKWKNKSDMVIATYIAGREYSELENVIGCFVNILPLRVNGLNNHTHDERLDAVKEICIEAYKNQFVPLEIMLESLGGIEGNRKSLSDVMFVLQNNAVEGLKLGPAKLETVSLKYIDSPYELLCNVYTGESLGIAFTFRTKEFKTKIIEELLNDYKAVLMSYV